MLTSPVGVVDHLGRYVGENTGKKLRRPCWCWPGGW
jgi:hypothetical protein